MKNASVNSEAFFQFVKKWFSVICLVLLCAGTVLSGLPCVKGAVEAQAETEGLCGKKFRINLI